MPKQDAIEEEIPWPLPGRTGVKSRVVFNANENQLNNLGNFRFQYNNYETGPARTKPLDPHLFGGEDFLRRAVGGNAARLGWSHPKTLKSMMDLARAQKDQGRPREAEPLLRKVLFEFESTFGPNHPNTIEVSLLLCEVLEDQLGHVHFITNTSGSSCDSLVDRDDVLHNIRPTPPKRQIHGDAATVPIERQPTTETDLVEDILHLRQSIAVAFEDQYGAEHSTTTDAVLQLSLALKRWALGFTEGEKQVQVLAHVQELQDQVRSLRHAHEQRLPPPMSLYVPTQGKGGLAEPNKNSTTTDDFTPGHLGIFG